MYHLNIQNRCMKRLPLFFFALILLLGWVCTPKQVNAQLRLLSPNGAENLTSGTSFLIRWSGVSSSDTVTLDYTTDAGATWNLIKSNVKGSSYQWNPIPSVTSSKCLVRITKAGTLGSRLLILKPKDQSDNKPGGYVEFSPDETRALTSNGNEVHLYDAFTGEELWKTAVFSNRTPNSPDGTGVAHFALNGTRIIVCIINESSGDTLHLLDASSGSELSHWSVGLNVPWQIPTGFFDRSLYAAVSPDGNKIAVSGFDTIRVFDVASQQRINLFPNANPTSGTIPYIAWTPDGNKIASANAANTNSAVRIIDANSGVVIANYTPNTNIISKIRFSNDGKTMAVLCPQANPSAIELWDVLPVQYKGRITNLNFFQDVGFSPDDSEFLTTDSKSPPAHGLWWDTKTLAPFASKVLDNTRDYMGDIDISKDGQRILVGATVGAVIYQPPTPIPGQADTSDNFFTIRAPIADTSIVLSLDSITANTNENISFKVRLQAGKSVDFTGVTSLQGKIGFNATLLEPVGATPKGSITQSLNTIDWQLPVQGLLPPVDTVVTVLSFRTGLGNDSVTPLIWRNVSSVTAPKSIEAVNGFLRLADICKEGGARFIYTSPKAYLTAKPTDKSEGSYSISFRTNEYGNTQIKLYNYLGIEVSTLVNESLELGEHKRQLSMDLMNSGVYFLVMTTPTERFTEVVRAIR